MTRPDLITLKDAARFNGESYRNAKRRAEQGRRQGLVHPEAHPGDARLKLYPVTHLLTLEGLKLWSREKENGNGALALFPVGAPGDETQAAALAPGEKDLARQRYRIIKPMLNGGWEKFRGERMADGRALQSKRDFVQRLAAQRNLAVNTLWAWRARYMKHGLPGLRRQPRSDKNVPRRLSTQDCIDLAALYASEGSAAGAHREFERQKQRRISYDSVLAVIRALPQPVKDRIRHGSKYLHDRHTQFITRDDSRRAPNGCWVFDHTELDFFVNAWDAERPARLWLTAIMDERSRYIVGWALSLQPDSLTIASALRMGLVNCGVPREVLLDNGKDFRSRYLSGEGRGRAAEPDFPEEARAGVFDRLRVQVRYCLPYHAQSKRIERFFRTLHERFDRSFRSYCGRNPSSRPAELQPLLEAHREAVRDRRPHDSPLPTIEEAAVYLERWINEYHCTPHRGLRGREPREVYVPSKVQLAPGMADLLLLAHEERKVERGAVSLFGRRYSAAGLEWYNGRDAEDTVKVCFDPQRRAFGDLGEVLVCCNDGKVFRCRYRPEPGDADELKRRLAEPRHFIRAVNAGLAELKARATVCGSGERRRRELTGGLDPRTPLVAAQRLLPKPIEEEQNKFANERFEEFAEVKE